MAARIKIRKYRRRPSLGATITSDSSSMFATNRIAESRSLRYIALSTVQKKEKKKIFKFLCLPIESYKLLSKPSFFLNRDEYINNNRLGRFVIVDSVLLCI